MQKAVSHKPNENITTSPLKPVKSQSLRSSAVRSGRRALANHVSSPSDTAVFNKIETLTRFQQDKIKKDKKVTFVPPEGRVISQKIQEKIEARRRSQEYASKQRRRLEEKMQRKDKESGGVLGIDSIYSDGGTPRRTASTGATM